MKHHLFSCCESPQLVTEKSKQGKAKMVDGETASKPAKKKAIAAVKKPKSKAPAEKPRSKILTGKPGNAGKESYLHRSGALLHFVAEPA